MKYDATQLSIIAEKVFEHDIVAVLQEEGAKGHTVYEGGGNGAFHLHPSQHASLVDGFRIIKIEVIVADPAAANRMATRLMNEFFQDQPGIVSLSEVKIFRPNKF